MPDNRQPLLVVAADIYTWEGSDVLRLQIRGIQRARVQKLKEILEAIEKDDAKPTPARARTARTKVFDPTVSFSAVTTLPDMVADLKARCTALLARI